ncbi:MAG: hypothetical protein ABI400_11295 [Lacisediminihabitans sp.]
MRATRAFMPVLGCSLLAFMLSGCTPNTSDSPATPASSAMATPGAAPAPTTSATPSAAPQKAAFTIPSDCHNLVNAATYSAVFAGTPLNDPRVVNPGEAGPLQPKTAPSGVTPEVVLASATQLRCVWRDPGADVTYLEATVATVDPAVASTYLDALAAQGYTCKQANGGRQCQLVAPNTQYPVDDAHTVLLRDTVYIYVGQSNFKTTNLMGSIATTIWG